MKKVKKKDVNYRYTHYCINEWKDETHFSIGTHMPMSGAKEYFIKNYKPSYVLMNLLR